MSFSSIFIPGIDRYCDRWCDRCAFTSRCRHYHIEQHLSSKAAPGELDIFNAEFWMQMQLELSAAVHRINLQAEAHPFSPDDAPLSLHRSAREHPCSLNALEYAGLLDQWKSSDRIWPLLPEEAGEIIRQYHYFLYPKLVRAIEVALTSSAGSTVGEVAEGTAKTVLIAIDRSLGAWGLVYRAYPRYEDDVLPLLLHLDRLRKSVEALFPAARAFCRPGLDE
ncbi:MAG: hypothetical protein K9G39_10845 [Chlorobium sp.]|uniref:hypothetical protein n=1 Tax=Chlorobium sp. TaxID=1095 RepID=UPI0025C0721E|nr:hypothetical protein [Chlorobium sp.]MCF8384065.1 hypothetical protein [Chlorobium sp.]